MVDIDTVIDWNAVEFMRFVEKICNDDFDRIKYVVSIIGYILSGQNRRYKFFQ